LEDDCLPDPTFFRYCHELLEYYRNDERIMMISGTNVLGQWQADSQSYHFSWYGGIWGWASWRRAWRHYDLEMTQWHDPVVKRRIRNTLASSRHYKMRARLFDKVAAGRIDTWDYQWSFARLAQQGLSVVPSVNLISNIGFGRDATHTTNAKTDLAAMAIFPAGFPICWNHSIVADHEYDQAFIKMVTSQQTLLTKLNDAVMITFRRLKRVIGCS
ncbi:MAG TPA: hypothetical protein VJ508_01540, partial [Saprospiraceae bacterium]|nr:hypothetical protein [Saprospiraceae bacterium]